MLLGAIRRAAAAGFSQRQIARAVGCSQPEVSRLLRFQPISPRGRTVAAKRRELLDLATASGFGNLRVFGSVARGDDDADSDVDLLVTAPSEVSLFGIARLEQAMSELLGERVEVVPDTNVPAHLADRVFADAAAL